MGGWLCEPLSQHFGNHMTDGAALLPAPSAELLHQGPGQIDCEDSSRLRYRSESKIALGLQQIAICLSARDPAPTDESRQNGRLLLLQHPNRHIDSLCLRCQRGSGHSDVYLIYYMTLSQIVCLRWLWHPLSAGKSFG